MDNFNLAEALLDYRKDHRLTQQQMGDMLGMSRQAYDRLEKDYRKPTYEELQRILKAIGRSIPSEDVAAIPTPSRKWNIHNLKRRLLYGTIKIADVLVHMKDLAKAIDCPVLLDWAHCELKGYLSIDEIPAYRLNGRSIEVDYKNGREKIFNLPIPAEMIDPGQKYPAMFTYLEGMKKWEEMISMEGKYFEGGNQLFPHMHLILQEMYGQNIEVRRVSIVTTNRVMRKALLAVQEILLTFLSDLDSKFGREADIDHLRAANQLITDLFLKAKDLVGNASHLDILVKPEPHEEIVLAKDNFEVFCIWLEDHDLMEFDELVGEFVDLLDEQERDPPPPGTIPLNVYDWVKKVVEENSRFGENGEKLIDALKIFYGVKN